MVEALGHGALPHTGLHEVRVSPCCLGPYAPKTYSHQQVLTALCTDWIELVALHPNG